MTIMSLMLSSSKLIIDISIYTVPPSGASVAGASLAGGSVTGASVAGASVTGASVF